MQLFIAIIPINGDLKNEERFPKNFTVRGWLLILCCAITTICTIFLFIKSDSDDDDNKIELQTGLKVRDSVNQLKIDKANEEYVIKLDKNNTNTIELLAKYGLKVDSAQLRIAKLVQDSARVVKKYYNTEDPIFSLCNVTIVSQKNDSISLKHYYCSEDATSYSIDFTLDIFCITTKNEFIEIWKNKRIVQPNTIIKKDKDQNIRMTLPWIPNAKQYIFNIKGSYKKFDGKIIPLDEITAYDFSKDPKPHFGSPNADLYKLIRMVIDQNK